MWRKERGERERGSNVEERERGERKRVVSRNNHLMS
jgi:hypothetical protein